MKEAICLASFTALPPRSMVGQLPLEQHIGVRIPGGQPMSGLSVVYRSPGKSEEVHLPPLQIIHLKPVTGLRTSVIVRSQPNQDEDIVAANILKT
jgi:hypothetical protein